MQAIIRALREIPAAIRLLLSSMIFASLPIGSNRKVRVDAPKLTINVISGSDATFAKRNEDKATDVVPDK